MIKWKFSYIQFHGFLFILSSRNNDESARRRRWWRKATLYLCAVGTTTTMYTSNVMFRAHIWEQTRKKNRSSRHVRAKNHTFSYSERTKPAKFKNNENMIIFFVRLWSNTIFESQTFSLICPYIDSPVRSIQIYVNVIREILGCTWFT